MDGKIQFNYRINNHLVHQFNLLTERMGGGKYSFVEAAVKVLLCLPDPVINYLKQSDTSLDDASGCFSGFHNRQILLDLMQKNMLDSTGDDFRMWQKLIRLVDETYKLP